MQEVLTIKVGSHMMTYRIVTYWGGQIVSGLHAKEPIESFLVIVEGALPSVKSLPQHRQKVASLLPNKITAVLFKSRMLPVLYAGEQDGSGNLDPELGASFPEWCHSQSFTTHYHFKKHAISSTANRHISEFFLQWEPYSWYNHLEIKSLPHNVHE